VKEGKGQALQSSIVAPVERTQYRVVTEAKRDAERFRTSIRSNTEWIFWTENKEGENLWKHDLPFLSLHYKVDTDVNGDALANRPTDLEISVTKLETALDYGNVENATLEVSFNEGKTWKKVNLNREGETFTTSIQNPTNAESVSLRASAWDDEGNKITQEIIKAYGLR
jgi:hypothetical protein